MRSHAAEAAALAGEAPVWVLSLAMPDGRTLRFSTDPISAETWPALDGPYVAQPTLAGVEEFAEELDVFGLDSAAGFTQASVSVWTTTDLAALASAWGHVLAARMELSILWAGEPWAARDLLIRDGLMQGLQIGRMGEASAFTIETVPAPSSATVGDDSHDLGTAFPAPLLDVVGDTCSDLTGRKGVTVLGVPESIPAYKVGVVAGSNRLFLCDHALPDLSLVEAFADGVSVGTFTPVVYSGTWGEYTAINDATLFAASDGAYTWSARLGGGIARADSTTKPTKNAADILRWLLAQSGLRVDWAKMQRALTKLATWPTGFWIDKEVSAIETIRGRLVSILPILEVNGGGGVWFYYADPADADVSGDLVEGQHLIGQVGPMTFSDLDAIRNTFTVAYAKEESAGTFSETVTVDGDTNAHCYLSRQLLARPDIYDDGTRGGDTIETDVLWEAVSARRAANAMAARLALPRRHLDFVASPWSYWIEPGEVYTLTSEANGIDGYAAACVLRSRGGGAFGLGFDLIDGTPTGSR